MSSLYRIMLENLSKLGFSLGISMGLGIILKAYLPRVLGVEQIGVFYYADSLSFIFFTFLPLGVHTFINRVIPPNPEKVKEVFRSIFTFMMVYGNLLWLMLWGYASILGYEGDYLSVIVLVGGYQFLFILTNEILKPIFVASDFVNFVSKMDIANKVVQVVTVCGGITLFPDLLAVAYLFLFAQGITFGLYLLKAIRLGWLKGTFHFSHCRDFITIGLPFFINSALLSFYGNIDVTMLERLADHVEVGWYGASQQLKGIFMMVVPLLYTVIMPLLSKSYARDKQEFASFAATIYRVLIYASWLLALGMSAFAEEFVLLLFGEDFLPATQAVVILAPVLLFTYMNVFLSMLLNLVSSGKGMVLTTLFSLILNAAMNFYLIPYGIETWGYGGGGIGASITTISAEILVFVVLLRLTPIRLLNRTNFLISLMSFLAVGGFIYLQFSFGNSLTNRIGLFAAFFILTAATGILVNRREIAGIWGKLRS